MEKEVMRERERKVAVCKGRRGDWMVDVTIDGHHQELTSANGGLSAEGER
jgi:hypothetical protein